MFKSDGFVLTILTPLIMQVLALIVAELHAAMPLVFGKDAKKKNLLKHLEQTIDVCMIRGTFEMPGADHCCFYCL